MALALYYIIDLFNISNQLPSYVTKSSLKKKKKTVKVSKLKTKPDN